MSTSDGYIIGTTKIVDHGLNSLRYNIVIVGDGYRASEMTKYHTDVQNFVDTFRATAPYNDLWCGINIHRVDVVSTDSGADDPTSCGDDAPGTIGTGAAPKTYFDSTFCGDGAIRRLLVSDKTSAKNVAHAQVPEVHFTMTLVNSSEYGGSGGESATVSTAPSAAEIALHEMGHTAFGFADEYEYYAGCASGETDHNNYTGGEPSEPNVTINTNKNTIKWKAALTTPADNLPTTSNGDCSTCDSQANPKADTYVGAYEGARYFHCGCFRPSFNCRMRALNNPFCGVCQKVIRDTLAPFLPAESLNLTTPSINFANIPEGLGGVGVTTYRAIVFEVVTCSQRTFHITSGPTGGFGTPLGTTVSVTANDADPVAHARLWISYTSTTAGAHAHGSVTVHCNETNQNFVISLDGNTVARPKSAVAMVLDHSGSMIEDAGGGITKVAKLREAANIFINAMLPGDGLSVVRFDDTSQILMPVTDVGPAMIGAGRIAATGHISGPEIDPAGNTSIGAGVANGKQALDNAQALSAPHYDVTSVLVLTDGEENTAPMIADVSGSLTANTFAIGLGQPQNISVSALNALTQGHNGYLLITGSLTSDQAARLNKYFLQILAGVTNANVILDPHGDLPIGAVHRIPFYVSETDYGADIFLLCPLPGLVDFELETPDGTRLRPGIGGNVEYVQAGNLSYYRMALPALPGDAGGTHAGLWHAVLQIDRKGLGRVDRQNKQAIAIIAGNATLPYDVVVHCYSDLFFKAGASQSGFEPGAVVSLHASLTEYDVPVENRASVWAEITRPDNSVFTLALNETEAGRFENSFTAALSGLYAMRVRARGETFRGSPFQREQTLSAAVFPGGNRPPKTGSGDGVSFWCNLLHCLLSERVLNGKLRAELQERGLNLAELARCLEKHCREHSPSIQEGPAKTGPTGIRATPSALSEEAVLRIAQAIAGEMNLR